MDKMRIYGYNFKNGEESKIRRKHKLNDRVKYYLDGKYVDKYMLLAAAYIGDNEDESWEILNAARRVFYPQKDYIFNALYTAVAFGVAQKFQRNEFYYHNLFIQNFSKIRNGKVVSYLNDNKNIPDVWVEYKNNETPVEIKLHNFNKKALNQLLRYMDCYKAPNGIAVGEKLTVDLPSNVEFISLEELENADLSKQEE